MPNRLVNWLHQSQISEHAQDMAAKTATALSGGTAVGSLFLTEYLQIAAIIVAIVSGLVATWWHVERIYDARQKRKKRKHRDDDSD